MLPIKLLSYLLSLLFLLGSSDSQEQCPDNDIEAEQVDLNKINGSYTLIGVLYTNATTTDANGNGFKMALNQCDMTIMLQPDEDDVNSLKMFREKETAVITFDKLPGGSGNAMGTAVFGLRNRNSVKILGITDTSLLISFCLNKDDIKHMDLSIGDPLPNSVNMIYFLKRSGSAIDDTTYPIERNNLIAKHHFQIYWSMNACSVEGQKQLEDRIMKGSV